MPSTLETAARLAAQEIPPRRYVQLLALLTQLKTWLDAATARDVCVSAIERLRFAATRRADQDAYQLNVAFGPGAGRVLFVPRGSADPVSFVDAVGATGVMFSLSYSGTTWSLVTTSGAVSPLTADNFTNLLAAQVGALMRAS